MPAKVLRRVGRHLLCDFAAGRTGDYAQVHEQAGACFLLALSADKIYLRPAFDLTGALPSALYHGDIMIASMFTNFGLFDTAAAGADPGEAR